MTSLSRRVLTRRDCCHSHLPTKESTSAACSSWLLKEVGPWFMQQFSSITSSAASSTDAGTVPISLLRGNHGTTSTDTASIYISSLIEVDGMVAGCILYPIRIGGSSVDGCELVAQLLYIAILKLPVDCFHIWFESGERNAYRASSWIIAMYIWSNCNFFRIAELNRGSSI